jgi:hypothetical protein
MRIGTTVVIRPSFTRRTGARLDAFVEDLMNQTSAAASKFTPRRSGAAARAWRVEGRGQAAEAVNRKPYIDRLEAGSSSQAPKGILYPTLQEIRRRRTIK